MAWAGATFLPFLVIALRALVDRGHAYLNGDFALLDMQVRGALRWQELVGVYSRFGWHHPGPLYLYLISLVERITGPTHGAQAQVAMAALIGGASLAGTVLVMGRLGGESGAAAAGLVSAVLGIAAGVTLASPWNPYVVVFPVVLLGVVGVAATRGSAIAWAGALVLSTFVIETDVGTALFALSVLVVSGVMLLRRRVRSGPAPPRRELVVAGVLVAVALVWWVPPLVDQFDGSGNVSALARFFVHAHGRAGLVAGAATAGTAEVASVGVAPPLFAVPSHAAGLLRLGALGALSVGLLVWSRRARDDLAFALSVVSAGGSVIAVIAGAGIVGAPFPYLMAWSAGVAATGLLALAVLGMRAAARRWTRAPVWTDALAGAALVAFFVWSLFATPVARLDNPEVAAAWNALAPHVLHDSRGIEVDQRATGLLLLVSPMWGVVDELDQHGLAPRVSAQWASHVAARYVTRHPGPVVVVLYPPSGDAMRLPGYVGHTRYADIVVVRRP